MLLRVIKENERKKTLIFWVNIRCKYSKITIEKNFFTRKITTIANWIKKTRRR